MCLSREKVILTLMRILSELVSTNVGIHRLLHGISRFFIFFKEHLFFIFNQMLSIGSFGRRGFCTFAQARLRLR